MSDDRSTTARPLLWVDLPAPGSATAGALVISGWAFRRGGLRIVEIEAYVGEHRIVIPQEVHRPDVALELDEPHADWCGFEGRLAVEESATERADRLVVRAIDELGASAEVEVPIRVVPSGRPLIEVEQARWSEDRVDIDGWLIWPASQPPRTVALLLGESRIAESVPNLSRPDIARRFPAFPSGACRGFRLRGSLDPHAVSAAGRAMLRVLATDAGGQRLEQTANVAREAPPGRSSAGQEAMIRVRNAVELARERIAHEPVILDWNTGLEAEFRSPGLTCFHPPTPDDDALPYLDATVDIVLVDGAASRRVAEARRVAAVATIESGALRWKLGAATRSVRTDASIIVPVGGSPAMLDAFLARLERSLSAGFRGELLLVGDRSAEERSAVVDRWIERWPALRFLQCDADVGFAARCNRGAELARGETIVFLDSRASPQPGWLMPLLRLLQDDSSIGAAGGKLLGADGTLREAGGVLYADGSALSFGLGDRAPNHPLYSFMREVDFCSRALLAVRRATFLELGGFEPHFGDEPLDVADLCLRLREKGFRACFEPASVAQQLDGGSSTADAGDAAKQLRSEARRQFAARWRRVLGAQPKPRETPDRASLYALSAPETKRRVLICAPRMPEFDRECGSQRLLHLVEIMQQAGWEVSYLAVKSVESDRYLRLLQQRGVAAYAGPDSVRAGDEYVDDLDELIVDGRFELAIVAFWSVAERLLPSFRSLSPATRVVVDSIDLHYLREERAALLAPADREPAANAVLRRERKRRELATYAAADAVFTVSAREAGLVEREVAHATPVCCVPLMEELAPARRGFHERQGLLFIGNFHHPPNLEGLEYLCAEILPRLDPAFLAAHPLRVVGNGANGHVAAAVAKTPHAQVVGWVPSVVPYLESALISLIPLRHGAGTKGKLIQALMVGTPSVSTSIGTEGLELEHGRHVLVADSAEEFATGIRRLMSEPMLWNRLAREGRKQIERAHGRNAVRTSLLAAVERALDPAPRRRAARLVSG